MEITQAPNGWMDKSEHEDDELDYIFKKQGKDSRSVTIYKHEWNGETQWTAKRRTSSSISDSYEIGKFDELDDAVAAAESWLNN